MNKVKKYSFPMNLMDAFVFTSIIIIFAFSNFKTISIATQFIVVLLTLFLVLERMEIKITIHFIWMILFIIWSLFIGLFADYIANSIEETLNLFLKFLYYTSLLVYIKNKENLLLIIKSIIFSGLLLVIRVLLFTPLSDLGTERLGRAVDLNANMVGIVLSFATILSIYLYLENKNKLYLFFPLIFITVSLLTGSKKAILAIIIGPILLIFFNMKNRVQRLLYVCLSVVIMSVMYLAIIEVPFLYNIIGERIEQSLFFIDPINIDKSTLHRSMMMKEAWELFKHNPIIGVGLENFREYSRFESYSHNNYTEILASTGFIGFILYFSLPITILLYSIYLNRNSRAYSLVISILITVLILDIANVSYRQLVTQIMIVIAVAKFIELRKYKPSYKDISVIADS